MDLTPDIKTWRLGLSACALALTTLALPSPASAQVGQRADFVAAERALQRGDSAAYIPLRQRLQGYALFPYLEYGELSAGLDTVADARVDAFLRDYADSPLAGSLRRAWLGKLADQGRWNEFLAGYDGDKSPALRCDQVRALLGTGDRDKAFALMPDLWRTGAALPSECDGPIADWRSAGGLTTELVWERFGLAMGKGEEALARRLAGDLPAADQAWAERWLRLRARPQAVLDSEFATDHPARDDAIAYGIGQWVRQDPLAAL